MEGEEGFQSLRGALEDSFNNMCNGMVQRVTAALEEKGGMWMEKLQAQASP